MESHRDPSSPLLSSRQAFLAMSEFIWRYAQSAGDDLLTLIGDAAIERDGCPTEPAASTDWLDSITWFSLPCAAVRDNFCLVR